jgi:hypothetical protein
VGGCDEGVEEKEENKTGEKDPSYRRKGRALLAVRFVVVQVPLLNVLVR